MSLKPEGITVASRRRGAEAVGTKDFRRVKEAGGSAHNLCLKASHGVLGGKHTVCVIEITHCLFSVSVECPAPKAVGLHTGRRPAEVRSKLSLQDLQVGGEGKIRSYFLSNLSPFETCHFCIFALVSTVLQSLVCRGSSVSQPPIPIGPPPPFPHPSLFFLQSFPGAIKIK